MEVLVIGANGNTGTRVVGLIKDQSLHEPVAMIRDTLQRIKFDSMGVTTVLGDLEYPIDHAISGCDAIIFAAGSGSHTGKEKTVLVDHIGAIRSIVTAQVHGKKWYIMLSAINADVNSNSGISHYHKAKDYADRHLMDTDLDWTIICPCVLQNKEGNGLVSLSSKIFLEGITTRDNLAASLVSCLDLPNTIGKRYSLLEGKTPLKDALQTVWDRIH